MLRSLNMYFGRVTPEGITGMGNARKLTSSRLGFEGPGSKEAAQKVKDALPNCQLGNFPK